MLPSLTFCEASAKRDHPLLSVQSTDSARADADKVLLLGSGRKAIVVVERRRGIGSARIQLKGSWKDCIKVEMRGFKSLEKFSVRKNNVCIESALGLPAVKVGTWQNEGCDCVRSQAGLDLLKMKLEGKKVLLEIPAEFARTEQSEVLQVSWIDAFRN